MSALCYYHYYNNNVGIALFFASISIVLSIRNIIVCYNGRFSFSSALISYTILTQFGLIIPYFFIDNSVVEDYPEWTMAFLDSKFLCSSIMMGSIGVLSYEIARLLSVRKYIENFDHLLKNNDEDDATMKAIAYILLLIVLFYFSFYISIGEMPLFGTYEMFINSLAYRNPYYPYILIFFFIATIYLASADSYYNSIIGWFIWLIIVLIFALNGNKGEFLYVLLAVYGLRGIQGVKISSRMIVVFCAIIFVIIPSITTLRSIGIASNLDSLGFDPFGAFTEMGIQIRTSVYTLEELDKGNIFMLGGQSYWQPLYNFVTPFLHHTTATDHLREMFPGFGYNQIIESYLNFGIVGVVLVYSLFGFLLTKIERQAKNRSSLAFIGSITTILINASRNYFSFVPGQIIIVSVIYLFYKRIKK